MSKAWQIATVRDFYHRADNDADRDRARGVMLKVLQSQRCGACKRKALPRCEGGQMVYLDGSSRECPNWAIRLNEIGGMTRRDAEREYEYQRQFD